LITVAVVSDVRLYRDGIADLVGRHPEISVTATAATVEDVCGVARRASPSVLLLDAAVERAREIIEETAQLSESVKTIVLGVTETSDVVAWAEAGADGYVSREASTEELAGAIQAVARGETVCSAPIATVLLRRLAAQGARNSRGSIPTASLTARERCIVELIDQGLTNREIATQLCIEVSTVKNHVHNILEKLNVHRRSQAAAILRTASRR